MYIFSILTLTNFTVPWHERLINHCDPTFPGRFEEYNDQIVEPKGGIWGTRPPKVLADVVEALVGAVHCEGGYIRGQRCALNVMNPITLAILRNDETEKRSYYTLMQPQQVNKDVFIAPCIHFIKIE